MRELFPFVVLAVAPALAMDEATPLLASVFDAHWSGHSVQLNLYL